MPPSLQHFQPHSALHPNVRYGEFKGPGSIHGPDNYRLHASSCLSSCRQQLHLSGAIFPLPQLDHEASGYTETWTLSDHLVITWQAHTATPRYRSTSSTRTPRTLPFNLSHWLIYWLYPTICELTDAITLCEMSFKRRNQHAFSSFLL